MGLQEKKMIAAIAEEQLPGMIAWVNDFYGKDLPFEIDYDSFGDFVGQGHMNNASVTADRICRNFFSSLKQALKNSVVKEEFQKQVQNITFACSEDKAEVLLADGHLQLRLPYRNEDFRPKHNEFVNWIEGVL